MKKIVFLLVIMTCFSMIMLADIQVSPEAFSPTLNSGENLSQEFTITNTGSQALDFDLYFQEPSSRDLSNIIVVDEAGSTMHYITALQNLGLPYTQCSLFDLESNLSNGTNWDLVIVNSYNNVVSSGLLSKLNQHITNGGFLIYCDWSLSYNPTDPLWEKMGFSYVSSTTDPEPIISSDTSHPIFSNPNTLSIINPTSNLYNIDGQVVNVLDSATQLAYLSSNPSSGACVLNAENTSLFNAFQAVNFNADDDADGKLDIVEFIENEITFFNNPLFWIQSDIQNGSLQPSESIIATIALDASKLTAGNYFAEMLVQDISSTVPSVTIPISLSVTGTPQISINPSSINFGELYSGTSFTSNITIKNTGSDLLTISSITTDNPAFTTSSSPFNLSPSESSVVSITFTPQSATTESGNLVILTDDPDNPTSHVSLSGSGKHPPIISTSSESVFVTLAENATSEVYFAINNSGLGELEYSISRTSPPSRSSRNYGNYATQRNLHTPLKTPDNMFTRNHEILHQRGLGDVLETYTGAFNAISGMVWVNDLLYLTCYGTSQLLVYNKDTQTIINTHPIHAGPLSITYDGNYLWIGESSGNAYAYNLDGSSTGFSFNTPVGTYPLLSWTGTHFIISPMGSSSPVFYLTDETGTVITSYSGTTYFSVDEMVWVPDHIDGNLWCTTNTQPYKISQIAFSNDTHTYSVLNQCDIPSGESFGYAITHHDDDLWYCDWDGPLYRLDDGINETNWISISPEQGAVSAQGNQIITLQFDSTELTPGTYQQHMIIASNDPITPEKTIPITLTVSNETPGSGSGSCSNGDPVVIDITEIMLNGATIDPAVTIDPLETIDLQFNISVSDAIQTNGLAAPSYLSLSYLFDVTGDLAGNTIIFTLDYTGFPTTINSLTWYDGTAWKDADNVVFSGTSVSFQITFPASMGTRSAAFEVVLGDDGALPVTLSSFTAQGTQNDDVRLQWITESEQNMMGYVVCRSLSESADFDFTSSLITATNTSCTQTYQYQDTEISTGIPYFYWLEAIDLEGTTTLYGPVEITIEGETTPQLPTSTQLFGCYPNPFNPTTTISFQVKEGETATLQIFNIKGQTVYSESFEAQTNIHTFQWDASELGSGVYFYQLKSNTFNETRKMMMIK